MESVSVLIPGAAADGGNFWKMADMTVNDEHGRKKEHEAIVRLLKQQAWEYEASALVMRQQVEKLTMLATEQAATIDHMKAMLDSADAGRIKRNDKSLRRFMARIAELNRIQREQQAEPATAKKRKVQ